MIRPTELSDLTDAALTEREALVAASILPGLPDGDVLVRVHDRTRFESDDAERFKEQVSPIAGTRLRRVTIDGDAGSGEQVDVTASPHGITAYRLSVHDFVAFARPEEAPDFDDTDQTFLSDFGFSTSATDAVHLGVRRTDDTFERKPVFPV